MQSRLRSNVSASMVLALSAFPTLLVSNASADTIVRDDFSEFTSTSGTPTIVGSSPSGAGNVNLPGQAYVYTASGVSGLVSSNSSGTGNPAPAASAAGTGGQGDLALSLASDLSTGYVKPTIFTVSADLYPGNLTGASAGERGIGLGFYSATGGQYTNSSYTGFVLDSVGTLALVHDTSTSGFAGTSLGSVAFGGTFNPNSFHTLAYTVNTASGAVSNISLSGSTADYNTTFSTAGDAVFQDPATNFLGLYTSSADGSTVNAFIDNVLVSSPVPEPTTLGVFGLGVLSLLCRRRS